ncbi:MAG: putative porin, partial [Cytophagales bacterium]
MNFRIQAILFFVGVFFINANAQKSKTIVDDTTKVIYGTNTAKIFTLETIYKEDRVFFNKDTLFDTPINKLAPNLELKFERPTLYNKEEAKLKFTADSIALLKKEEADKLALEATDTTAQRKKDSLNDPYLKFLRFFKAKPLKPLPYKTRFFKNEYAYFKSDTSIDRIQQYNMNYINDNIYQNLGVIGTPSKPVFLTQPSTLGYQSGYNVYNVYYTDPTKVRYFNSKSPYTNVYYVGNPGTTNEDRIKFDINRNITRNWNFGFSYERIYTDKLIGQSGSASRSLALGQEFIVYSSTKSRNGRYHFMANTNYFLFFANEQGGLARINSNNASSEATLLSDNELPTNIGGWPV